jgi:hypothetical protein
MTSDAVLLAAVFGLSALPATGLPICTASTRNPRARAAEAAGRHADRVGGGAEAGAAVAAGAAEGRDRFGLGWRPEPAGILTISTALM